MTVGLSLPDTMFQCSSVGVMRLQRHWGENFCNNTSPVELLLESNQCSQLKISKQSITMFPSDGVWMMIMLGIFKYIQKQTKPNKEVRSRLE